MVGKKVPLNTVVTLSKREFFRKMLANGPVCVHLDPRKDGVVVPSEHAHQPRLVLVFGYTLPKPTNDVMANQEALVATLSFDQRPCAISIPWMAVFGIADADGEGYLWDDDVPPEITEGPAKSPPEGVARERPRLGVLVGGKRA